MVYRALRTHILRLLGPKTTLFEFFWAILIPRETPIPPTPSLIAQRRELPARPRRSGEEANRWFRIVGLGFWVLDLRLRVKGLDSGFRVYGLG